MKKKTFMIIICCFFTVAGFSQEDLNWVDSIRIQRKTLLENNRSSELDQLDLRTLENLKKKDISQNEKEVSRLITYIISTRNYDSKNNIALAFNVLSSCFTDKNYFLDIVYDFSNYEFMSNYLILTSILNGFQRCIDTNEEKLFRSYVNLSPSFDLYLFNQQKVGASSVIVALIGFLSEYFLLAEEKKISGRYDNLVMYTYSKMNISGKSKSDFLKYAGSEQLKKNYNFYMNNRKKID